jgi:hypothetical protein
VGEVGESFVSSSSGMRSGGTPSEFLGMWVVGPSTGQSGVCLAVWHPLRALITVRDYWQ